MLWEVGYRAVLKSVPAFVQDVLCIPVYYERGQ